MLPAVLGVFLVAACRTEGRSDDSGSQASSPQPDRLAAELASWPARWTSIEAPPSCEPLLSQDERASCLATLRALEAQRALKAEAPAARVMEHAVTLALAAQRATVHLRSAGLRQLLDDRHAQPPPAGSAAPRSSAVVKPATSGSPLDHEHHPPLERQQSSPHLRAISAYSRLSSLALRQLGVYLQYGPPELRTAALQKLERLSSEQRQWESLRALAAEAALLERDPDRKRRLLALAKSMKD